MPFLSLGLHLTSCTACRFNLAVQKLDKRFAASPIRFMRTWACALILTGYLVHHFTLVHPFLVADNRSALLGLVAQNPQRLFAMWQLST